MENVVYKLSQDWVLHKEDSEIKKFYLFNISDGTIVKLNEVSYDFLSLIDGETGLDIVIGETFKIFKVEKSQLLKDLSELIQKCRDHKILI